MSRHEFKLPDIGEGIAEAEIAQWRVAVGDAVHEDQPLVDMLTEKAAVEVPSPVAGSVIACYGNAGDKIPIGSVIVVIETPADDTAAPGSAGRGAVAPAVPVADPAMARRRDPELKPMASPSVRRRARERGIELARVAGSGPQGRITHDDIESFTAHPEAAARTAAVPPGRREGVEQVRVIGVRRKIAEAMQRAKQRIPHFAYIEELDVTELESLRAHLNGNRAPQQTKLTLLPFLMQALARVLVEFPQINARFDDDNGVVLRFKPVHVGVATQTPNGLMVPVVHHAEALHLWQSAAEIKRVSEAARAGKATREELSGSTITITSLGAMGGIASTPIINAPEVAIIGVNRIVERPVVFNGHISARRCMNLSSSFDHRVVDGWDAASFIQRIKAMLEHPATLFMT